MSKKLLLILFLIYVGLLLTALIGVLGGALANDLPKDWTAHPLYLSLIFAALLVIAALAAYWLYHLQTTDKSPSPSLASLDTAAGGWPTPQAIKSPGSCRGI